MQTENSIKSNITTPTWLQAKNELLAQRVEAKEKLMDTLASLLEIEVTTVDSCPEVTDRPQITISKKKASDDVKSIFRQKLEKHICRKLNGAKMGDTISYDFSNQNSDKNSSEILSSLPKLPEGQAYSFPSDISVSFLLRSLDGSDKKLTYTIKPTFSKELFEAFNNM